MQPGRQAQRSILTAASGEHGRPLSRIWVRIIQIAFTSLALLWLIRSVSWHDQVVLADGELHRLVSRNFASVFVAGPAGGPLAVAVPKGTVQEFRPGVWSQLLALRWSWLLAFAAGCALCGILLVTRWRYVLHTCEFSVAWHWCALVWARAQCIGALPLSSIGGDMYRIACVCAQDPRTADAAGVVVAERVIGLLGLIATGVLGILLYRASVGIACAIAIAAAITISVLGLQRFPDLPSSSGQGVRPRTIATTIRELASFLRPVRNLASHRRRLLVVLGLSFAIQLVSPLTFVAVDRALGLRTPVWCYWLALPAVSLVQYLPIHVAGLGILEGGLWLVVGRLGHRTAAEILAISTASRVLGLLWLLVLSVGFLCPLPRAAGGRARSNSSDLRRPLVPRMALANCARMARRRLHAPEAR